MNFFQIIVALWLEVNIVSKTADRPWISFILPVALFIIQLIPVRKEPGIE